MSDIAKQPCDFCGSPVVWTRDEININLALRLRGFGLGVSCPDCDARQAGLAEVDFAGCEDV